MLPAHLCRPCLLPAPACAYVQSKVPVADDDDVIVMRFRKVFISF